MKLTTRRIVLVLLVLVLSVLVYMMITDRPASAASLFPTQTSTAGGGIAMLATICSLGGFVAGGGSIYIYAKATNQTIEWRGVPFVGRIYLRFWPQAERRIQAH